MTRQTSVLWLPKLLSFLSLAFRENDLPTLFPFPDLPFRPQNTLYLSVFLQPPSSAGCERCSSTFVPGSLCSFMGLLSPSLKLSSSALELLLSWLHSSLLNFWYSPNSVPIPSLLTPHSLFGHPQTHPFNKCLVHFSPIYRDWSAMLTLLLVRGCLHLHALQHPKFNRFKLRPIICFPTIPLGNTFLPYILFSQLTIPSSA